MNHTTLTLTSITALAASSLSAFAAEEKSFLDKVKDNDPLVKLEAWREADKQKPEIIAELAKLIGGDDKATEKAAVECIQKITHSVGISTKEKNREAVTKELIKLIDKKSPAKSRLAFRMLSEIADPPFVVELAKYLSDADMFEEAIFCIERIPGEEAAKALLEALKTVPDKNKERVCVALGHRKEQSAMEPLCALFTSGNMDLALKAVEAVSKIGGKVPEGTDMPDFDAMNERQKAFMFNCLIRYIDNLIAKGENLDFAQRIVPERLNDSDIKYEEHQICALLGCVSKIDEPELVQELIKKLTYEPSYIVRTTAANLLISSKGKSVDETLKKSLETAEEKVKKEIQAVIDGRKKKV